MSWVRVEITATAGSVPREAGTQMLVFADRIEGTIGGGALEWQAMATARRLLAMTHDSLIEKVPLGPALGQCCGGSVTLRYQRGAAIEETTKRPIWIYGAGHVGRQVASVLAGLPDCLVTLIDVAADRFPDPMPEGVTRLLAADPPRIVGHAPENTEHLIMTCSHEVDLALCNAILNHRFARAGLIGSATKWVRFEKRLRALGHAPAQIRRIACPIGNPSLGKHPMQIAIGVAAAMIAPAVRTPKEIAS